jgi:glycosyltransferase involved in cell wall biosynthesis
MQTFRDIEIVVVNDGSTDKTPEVAREFVERFKKDGIRYEIIEQENKGAPNARNRGYQESRGDFILFCDADAILERNYLSEMIKALEGNLGASYAYSAHYWGRKLFKLWPFNANKLRQMPYIHSVSLIRKKDFPVGGWDENIKRLQDWDLWLTMLEENHQGVWINKPLFKISTGGTMSSWLPSIAYKLLPFLPEVKKYQTALKTVKEKHGLL